MLSNYPISTSSLRTLALSKLRFTLTILVCLVWVPSLGAQESQSTAPAGVLTPPLDAFSRIPAYQDVSLSPAGSKAIFVQNFAAPENVAILTSYNFKTGEIKRIMVSDNIKTKINWVNWVNEDVILLSARYETRDRRVLYYQTRMFSVDLSAKELELKRLLKSSPRDSSNRVSQFQDSVIDYLPSDPDHVLIEVDFDKPSQPSVYKLNVRTAKRKRLEKGKRSIRTWMTDQQNQIRIGRARDYETGEITYYERVNEDENFRELLSYMSLEDKPISIKGFDLDPNIIYLTKYKGDKQALYKMALDTMETELILANDDYDVSGRLIYSPTTQDVIGVYDSHSPFGRYYFDQKDYALHEALDEIFPDTNNFVVSRSDDENVYVLYSESDAVPGHYYVGNRKENTLKGLFSAYPELQDASLPQHESITYTARDGMEIQAFITLPLFGEAPYPTVMHPHGGPGSRDFDGFDPWVSYMNSRGYAVMRPNFRGSTGFGYEFAQAQMGRWGLEMQDDITDAANYMIKEGMADPDKFCIFGASYGGYAAAMATVKTPDLFTCAVSFAGVVDLKALARTQSRFLGGDLIADKQIGEDSSDLKSRSPINFVEKITTPILVMHGKEDRSVSVDQSRDFADELEDEDKNFKYVEFEFGDHYLSYQQNRTAFFEELDAFLTLHLGKVEAK